MTDYPAGYFTSVAFKAANYGYHAEESAREARQLQAHPGDWYVWQMSDGRWWISLLTNRAP
jgi:hypothetical protein